ncbi:MAG: hypothetical protein KF746_06100 [Chitinophagaceae bacterium]|nr:hypothetical protein [Chitinophagaceae bacterium]
MKQVLISITVFLFSLLKGSAQNTYYDAVQLSNILTQIDSLENVETAEAIRLKKEKRLLFYQLLMPYVKNTCAGATPDSIRSCLLAKRNPFFSTAFLPSSSGDMSVSLKALRGLAGAVGNLDVTSFADGLAQFLVERTKEELNVAFFQKFSDFLENYPEFRILFPNTNTFIAYLNIGDYANTLNTLKEAFDKDLKALLPNAIRLSHLDTTACSSAYAEDRNKCVLRIDAIQNFFNSNNGLLVRSALQIGNGIMQQAKIPDMLDSIIRPAYLAGYAPFTNEQDNTNLSNGLQLIRIISSGIRSMDPASNYISEQELALLKSDEKLRAVFFGLLYEEINGNNIVINNLPVTAVLQPGRVASFITYMEGLLNEAKAIQAAWSDLKVTKSMAEAELSKQYGAVFEHFRSLLLYAANLQVIDQQLLLPPVFTHTLTKTAGVFEIAHDISVKNYNAAVLGFLKLLSVEAPAFNNRDTMNQFLRAFLKYGSFAANVVTAKDPAEVKAAIKAVALPAGSAALKKQSSFSITVNAYVGLVTGYNQPFAKTFTSKDPAGNIVTARLHGSVPVSLFAPVGFAFNWSTAGKKNGLERKYPGAVSAFVSVIDVGALVGFRFMQDSGLVSDKMKVKLANIFAPGVNFMYGFPKAPLSVGIGVQWVPSLQRNAESNEFFVLTESGIRYQLHFALDIPMFSLRTSRKSYLYP